MTVRAFVASVCFVSAATLTTLAQTAGVPVAPPAGPPTTVTVPPPAGHTPSVTIVPPPDQTPSVTAVPAPGKPSSTTIVPPPPGHVASTTIVPVPGQATTAITPAAATPTAQPPQVVTPAPVQPGQPRPTTGQPPRTVSPAPPTPAQPRMALPTPSTPTTLPTPAQPPRERREGQPLNIRVDVSITDQRTSGAAAAKKTVSVVTADGMGGFIRSQATYVNIGDVPLNVDIEPLLLSDGKIRVRVNLQYELPASPNPSQNEVAPQVGSLRKTSIHENLSLVLENGKPIVAAQSADPVGDRQVTIEVKATVLR